MRLTWQKWHLNWKVNQGPSVLSSARSLSALRSKSNALSTKPPVHSIGLLFSQKHLDNLIMRWDETCVNNDSFGIYRYWSVLYEWASLIQRHNPKYGEGEIAKWHTVSMKPEAPGPKLNAQPPKTPFLMWTEVCYRSLRVFPELNRLTGLRVYMLPFFFCCRPTKPLLPIRCLPSHHSFRPTGRAYLPAVIVAKASSMSEADKLYLINNGQSWKSCFALY